MPRSARIHSPSGIYHIMLRGINKQQVLEDNEDNEKFLEILQECKGISEYKLFGYILMGNHLHLNLKVEKEPLEQIFKRICGRYVYWYNAKYQRVGHLFQDRFKSEPIKSEKSFFNVLRYIHQNPVKAGLVKNIEDYPYSSYRSYLEPKSDMLVDVDFAFDQMSRKEFMEYHNEVSDDEYLDIAESSFRVTDELAKDIILKISQCKNASEFQMLEIKSRNRCIRQLRNEGLSIRQISRLTGISKGIIERCDKPGGYKKVGDCE